MGLALVVVVVLVVVLVALAVVAEVLEMVKGLEVVKGLLVTVSFAVTVEIGASLVSMMLVDVSDVLRNLAVMLLILEWSSSVERSRSLW